MKHCGPLLCVDGGVRIVTGKPPLRTHVVSVTRTCECAEKLVPEPEVSGNEFTFTMGTPWPGTDGTSGDTAHLLGVSAAAPGEDARAILGGGQRGGVAELRVCRLTPSLPLLCLPLPLYLGVSSPEPPAGSASPGTRTCSPHLCPGPLSSSSLVHKSDNPETPDSPGRLLT